MSRYYLCNLDGRDYLVTPAQLNAEKYTPVAVFSQDAGVVESALAALAQQQSERNASTWRVEYPEFKNQLTELFLSVEECVLLNQSEDYDMEEWLTKYTSFYEIVHGVPWWLEDAPEGWYARAMDAGSWYTIVIPDSIVSQVQAICEEQARYPEQDFFYSVLYHADTVRVPVEPGAWDQIKDQETVSALANLFLENLTVPTSNWQPHLSLLAVSGSSFISLRRKMDTCWLWVVRTECGKVLSLCLPGFLKIPCSRSPKRWRPGVKPSPAQPVILPMWIPCAPWPTFRLQTFKPLPL